MDIKEYHKDKKIVSSTGLKQAAISSRHFAYYLQNEQVSKPEFDFGNAFELALIDKVKGSNEFKQSCIILDESKRPEQDKGINSKINQAWKKEILSSEKYVLSTDDKLHIDNMVESCLADDVIKALLKFTEYQESFFWTCPETGVNCKTRPDITKRKKNVILDIKTTKDASPKWFTRDIVNYDYPLQGFMQMQGSVHSGFMPEVDEYFWLAVEKSEPYNAVIYRFKKEEWQVVEDRYYFLLNRCKHVIDNDLKWQEVPGYKENADNKFGIIDVDLPAYY